MITPMVRWKAFPGRIAAVLVAILLCCSGCGRRAERTLRSGLRDLDRGRDMRALTRFEQALAQNPDDVEAALAWNGIGVVAARTGDEERAIAAFEASQRLHPNDGVSAYNLGVMRARTGDVAEATALLARAALLHAEDPAPLQRLAQLLAEHGMTESALERLREAREIKPHSPAILTAIGVVEWRASGPRAGLTYFIQALEHDASYAPALYNLFVLWDREMNRPKEALAFGRRFLATAASPTRLAAVRLRVEAIETRLAEGAEVAVRDSELDPAPHVRSAYERRMDEARAKSGQGVPAAEAALQAAAEARRAGDRGAQEEALRFALDEAFDQSWVHAAWGAFEHERGHRSEAQRSYQRALALNARDADALVGLGLLAVEAGRHAEALEYFLSAGEADPAHADAHWHAAERYAALPNQGREAMRAYRLFAQRFPADARAVDALARARAQAERLQAEAPADQPPPPREDPPRPAPADPPRVDRGPTRPAGVRPFEYRRADRRDPEAARAAFERAARHQEARDYDRAVFFYQRAFELDDRMVSALYNLATVHHDRGAHDEARSVYYAVLERDQAHEAARYNLAMLYHGRGDRARALEHLRHLIRVNERYASAWYLAGLIHSEREAEHAEARRHFQRFLSLAPNDPAASSVRRWLERQP